MLPSVKSHKMSIVLGEGPFIYVKPFLSDEMKYIASTSCFHELEQKYIDQKTYVLAHRRKFVVSSFSVQSTVQHFD